MQGPVELAYAAVPIHCIKEVYILLSATSFCITSYAPRSSFSREDHLMPPSNGRRIAGRIQSSDYRMLVARKILSCGNAGRR
jgi:hypothetical protein